MKSTKRNRWILLFSIIAGFFTILWFLERRWSQWFTVVQSGKSSIEGQDGLIYNGYRITIQSIIACPLDQAWDYALTSELIHNISWPFVRMKNVDEGVPERWNEGATIHVKLSTFGVIPLGWHTIHVKKVDEEQGLIHTLEHGQFIHALDHTIQIEPYGRNLALYTDDVIVNAGIFTMLLAWGVKFFYRYRQSRWQHFARGLEAVEVRGYLS